MNKKILLILTLLCCVTVAGTLSVFVGNGTVLAENSNVMIDITKDSHFTAFGDTFSLVTDQNVYVVKDSKVLSYKEQSPFTVLDMAMNSKYLLLLVSDTNGKALYTYEYNNSGLTRIEYKNSDIRFNVLEGLYTGQDGVFFALEPNKTMAFSIDEHLSGNPGGHMSNVNGTIYENVDGKFCIANDILYCLADGDLYAVNSHNYDNPDLTDFLKLEGNYTDLTFANNTLILLDSNKAYKYDSETNSTTELLGSGIDATSSLASTYISEANTYYVYIKSDLPSLNMYVFDGNTLEYYNTFDRTIYSHPDKYDKLTMQKVNSEAIVYSSPRHLQKLATLSSGDYIILLNEVGEYYYVYFQKDGKDVNLGYIRKDSDITLCPANTNCDIGFYAQALHPDTAIYRYPFAGNGMNPTGSEAIAYATIYDQLVVVDNVGQDGDHTWGWYKVGYLTSDNKVVYGYIREKDVSPYTVLTPPAISKTVKVSSKKLGEYIKVYALPQDDAKLVVQLKEGTSIDLGEKYDKNSEWTKVIYNDMIAYVKTENIQPGGLTSWQLALAITIPIVVVAILVTVIILVVVKKRKYLNRMF